MRSKWEPLELRTIKKFSEALNEFTKEDYFKDFPEGRRSEFMLCLKYLRGDIEDKIEDFDKSFSISATTSCHAFCSDATTAVSISSSSSSSTQTTTTVLITESDKIKEKEFVAFLKDFEPTIKKLGYAFKIPGIDRADIQQELRILLFRKFKTAENLRSKEGFAYKACRNKIIDLHRFTIRKCRDHRLQVSLEDLVNV